MAPSCPARISRMALVGSSCSVDPCISRCFSILQKIDLDNNRIWENSDLEE